MWQKERKGSKRKLGTHCAWVFKKMWDFITFLLFAFTWLGFRLGYLGKSKKHERDNWVIKHLLGFGSCFGESVTNKVVEFRPWDFFSLFFTILAMPISMIRS